jgi:hypothetical protein
VRLSELFLDFLPSAGLVFHAVVLPQPAIAVEFFFKGHIPVMSRLARGNSGLVRFIAA